MAPRRKRNKQQTARISFAEGQKPRFAQRVLAIDSNQERLVEEDLLRLPETDAVQLPGLPDIPVIPVKTDTTIKRIA